MPFNKTLCFSTLLRRRQIKKWQMTVSVHLCFTFKYVSTVQTLNSFYCAKLGCSFQRSMDIVLRWAISHLPLWCPILRTYKSYLPSSSASSCSITLSCCHSIRSPIPGWLCIRLCLMLGQLFLRKLLSKSLKGGTAVWLSTIKGGSSIDPLPMTYPLWPALMELMEAWEPQWCSWIQRDPDDNLLRACMDKSSSDSSLRFPDMS